MIYLLYGSDTTGSLKKLNEIINEFRGKYGNLNVHKFDAEETESAAVKTVLETGSLFAPKKLVIIKYFFASSWDRARFYELLEKIKKSPDTTLVIWDRELAEKDVSEVRPHCSSVQEFKMSAPTPLGRGFDRSVGDVSIFRLGDTFFSSRREALRCLLHLLHLGHDDSRLFLYLVNHARTLFIIKQYADKRTPVPTQYGIHPYVIKKAASLARTLSGKYFHDAFCRFFEEDRRIKIGILRPKDSLIRMLLP